MSKKAYVSIEGESAYVYLPENKKVEKLDTTEFPGFLSMRRVKGVVITVFLEGLQTVRIPFQASLSSVKKNRGLINSVIRAELQKRGVNFTDVIYNYSLQEHQGVTLITVYFAQSENFSFLRDILEAGIEVHGCYPSFAPISAYISSSGLEPKSRAIFVISEKFRMLFITDGRDLLLQRSFSGESEELSPDDISNVDATMGFAIRSFRTRIQEILIFSKTEYPFDGIGVETRFVVLPELENYPLIPLLTERYEKKLKGMELLPKDLKTYATIKDVLKYTKILLSFAFLALIPFSVYNYFEYEKLSRTYSEKEKKVLSLQAEISPLMNKAKELESSLKPYISVVNRKNSNPDSRELLYKLSDLSRIDSVSLNSVQITLDKVAVLSLSGSVSGTSFEKKERTFDELKNSLVQRGFKISEEKWDIMKGEFTIKINYGT